MATMVDDEGRTIDIVPAEAVAALSSVGALQSERRPSAERIQQAMAAAIKHAYSEGITDPAEIKELMLAAREYEKQHGAVQELDRK